MPGREEHQERVAATPVMGAWAKAAFRGLEVAPAERRRLVVVIPAITAQAAQERPWRPYAVMARPLADHHCGPASSAWAAVHPASSAQPASAARHPRHT